MTDKISIKKDKKSSEIDAGAEIDLDNDKKSSLFIAPIVGESFKKYADAVSIHALKEAQETLQESTKSQLTQQVYELIRDNALNAETLAAHTEGGAKGNMESKCNALKERYTVGDEGIVRDKRREGKIVCEPACIFDIVVCGHFMNRRMTYKPLYKNLNDTYANITRDFVQKVVRCCSNSNDSDGATPKETPKPAKNKPIENIYKNLLPLERAHLEVFRPFEDELIDGKYSHILYLRDYQTRYVWLLPLKNTKFKRILTSIATFLLNMPQIPLFIESSTFEKQDLFDICEKICKSYHLKIGLGNSDCVQFQLNGIAALKTLLTKHKSSCVADWNMCVLHGSYAYNRIPNPKSMVIPNNQLWNDIPHLNKSLKSKQDEILEDLSSHNVVKVGQGMIYLEGDKTMKMQDEERDYEKSEEKASKRPLRERMEKKDMQYDISAELSVPSTSFYGNIESPARKRHQTSLGQDSETSVVL